MGESKLKFSLGNLSFSAEGDQVWLAQQLDKILDRVAELENVLSKTKSTGSDTSSDQAEVDENFTAALAAHIRDKKGESNQVQRFLATADWLRRRGNNSLTTAAVSKALSENHQKRLSNPADCLNKNVAKGHCEKKGDGFFITPDGLKQLGY